MDETPRLVSCWFGEGDQGDMYRRLAAVLEHTARQHCPGWDIRVPKLEALWNGRTLPRNPSFLWNTQKFEHWMERLVELPDGTRVLLIDGDTMIVRPLDPVWDLDFDLAYTIRQGTRLPLNAGVVFLRASNRTRAFIRKWWEMNVEFYENEPKHRPWRQKYAGINQASFGYMLEEVDHGCRLLTLPCAEWNLCQWDLYDPAVTRIVHVKSSLRRATFNSHPAPRFRQPTQSLISMWKRLEKEALAACA